MPKDKAAKKKSKKDSSDSDSGPDVSLENDRCTLKFYTECKP